MPDLTQTEKIHCTEKNTQCLRAFWMQGNIFFKNLVDAVIHVCLSEWVAVAIYRVRVQW